MPGIGRRSAERLTYFVLNRSGEDAARLARAIADVKEKVGMCSVCYNIAEADPCSICRDAGRRTSPTRSNSVRRPRLLWAKWLVR